MVLKKVKKSSKFPPWKRVLKVGISQEKSRLRDLVHFSFWHPVVFGGLEEIRLKGTRDKTQ